MPRCIHQKGVTAATSTVWQPWDLPCTAKQILAPRNIRNRVTKRLRMNSEPAAVRGAGERRFGAVEQVQGRQRDCRELPRLCAPPAQPCTSSEPGGPACPDHCHRTPTLSPPMHKNKCSRPVPIDLQLAAESPAGRHNIYTKCKDCRACPSAMCVLLVRPVQGLPDWSATGRGSRANP